MRSIAGAHGAVHVEILQGSKPRRRRRRWCGSHLLWRLLWLLWLRLGFHRRMAAFFFCRFESRRFVSFRFHYCCCFLLPSSFLCSCSLFLQLRLRCCVLACE